MLRPLRADHRKGHHSSEGPEHTAAWGLHVQRVEATGLRRGFPLALPIHRLKRTPTQLQIDHLIIITMTTTSIHRHYLTTGGRYSHNRHYLPPCNPVIPIDLKWLDILHLWYKNHSFIPANLFSCIFQEGNIANLQKWRFFFSFSNLSVSVLPPLLFVQCRLHYDCKFVYELWFLNIPHYPIYSCIHCSNLFKSKDLHPAL